MGCGAHALRRRRAAGDDDPESAPGATPSAPSSPRAKLSGAGSPGSPGSADSHDAQVLELEAQVAELESRIQGLEQERKDTVQHWQQRLEDLGVRPDASLQDQEAQVQERRHLYEMELEQERTELEGTYREDLEVLERQIVDEQRLADQLSEQRYQAEMTKEREARYCLELQEEARRHREEADSGESEVLRLRVAVAALKRDHEEASEDLVALRAHAVEAHEAAGGSELEGDAHELGLMAIKAEAQTWEERLAESRGRHAESEKEFQEAERELTARTRQLRAEKRAGVEELHARELALRDRTAEIADVNAQLSDLQGLFDDVNAQLQGECSRIAHIQGTVALCAKQSDELRALQAMLEESHRMLAQVRDALETERSERARTSRLLQHEQQRTQLLLDVLKHFKEKLQGLTPQMLLSRLGLPESQELLQQLAPPTPPPALPASHAGSFAVEPCGAPPHGTMGSFRMGEGGPVSVGSWAAAPLGSFATPPPLGEAYPSPPPHWPHGEPPPLPVKRWPAHR